MIAYAIFWALIDKSILINSAYQFEFFPSKLTSNFKVIIQDNPCIMRWLKWFSVNHYLPHFVDYSVSKNSYSHLNCSYKKLEVIIIQWIKFFKRWHSFFSLYLERLLNVHIFLSISLLILFDLLNFGIGPHLVLLCAIGSFESFWIAVLTDIKTTVDTVPEIFRFRQVAVFARIARDYWSC